MGRCVLDLHAPAAAPEDGASRKRRSWMTQKYLARKVGKLALSVTASAAVAAQFAELASDAEEGCASEDDCGSRHVLASNEPGSPDARAADALLAVQQRVSGYIPHVPGEPGATPAGPGVALETPGGMQCVRYISSVDWQVLCLVDRPEGLRVQYFTLRGVPLRDFASKLPVELRPHTVEVAPMRWDASSSRAVAIDAAGDEFRGHMRGVTFVIKFGQDENALTMRPGVPGEGGAPVLEVALRDTQTRVRSVDIVSCGTDSAPAKRQRATMANLCGKVLLAHALDIGRLRHVLRKTSMQFGCIYDVPTTTGRIGVQRDLRTMFVKGACQYGAVLRDARSLLQASVGEGAEEPSLWVYMLVLVGAVGANAGMQLGASLLERTVRWHPHMRGVLSVYPRSEEEMNRVEFVSYYTQEVGDKLARIAAGGRHVGRDGRAPHCGDARLHISVTRKGEAIFRFGFLGRMLQYNEAVDVWARSVCDAYIDVFAMALEGSLKWA